VAKTGGEKAGAAKPAGGRASRPLANTPLQQSVAKTRKRAEAPTRRASQRAFFGGGGRAIAVGSRSHQQKKKRKEIGAARQGASHPTCFCKDARGEGMIGESGQRRVGTQGNVKGQNCDVGWNSREKTIWGQRSTTATGRKKRYKKQQDLPKKLLRATGPDNRWVPEGRRDEQMESLCEARTNTIRS